MLQILASTSLLLNTAALVSNLFLHYIPNVLYGINFWQIPGYFRTCISLHSMNVLVLLDLWNGTRSCIKIYTFFGNTTHSHLSVCHSHNNRRHNEEYHAKCIQATVKSPVSVQVCEAISSRFISLQRKVNGNMDSANTSVILSMILKYYLSPLCSHSRFNFIHDIAPCHNSKSTRTFQGCKGIPVLK